MNPWHRFHRWPRRLRWPVKVCAFLAVLGLVLYPKVWLLPVWLHRLGDMNSVLDPSEPALAPLEEEVRAKLPPESPPEITLKAVQDVVYLRIPYAWDWEVWGVMDYLPTTAEALAQGREDCDGRAVISASLLRRMGLQAWLVSDLEHTWVATPYGETMSPGAGEKTLVGAKGGTQTRFSFALLPNIARAAAYGVAVFPWQRELVILGAFCGLAMHPWSSVSRRILGCLLLALALALFHFSPDPTSRGALRPWLVWSASLAALAGWLLLALRARGKPIGPIPARPG